MKYWVDEVYANKSKNIFRGRSARGILRNRTFTTSRGFTTTADTTEAPAAAMLRWKTDNLGGSVSFETICEFFSATAKFVLNKRNKSVSAHQDSVAQRTGKNSWDGCIIWFQLQELCTHSFCVNAGNLVQSFLFRASLGFDQTVALQNQRRNCVVDP